MKYALVVAVLLSFAVPVKAEQGTEVTIQGSRDCGAWLEVREEHPLSAGLYEFWLVGLLDGVSLNSGIEFWEAGDGVTPNQVYYWTDKYCRENPLNDVMDGARLLFHEKTGY